MTDPNTPADPFQTGPPPAGPPTYPPPGGYTPPGGGGGYAPQPGGYGPPAGGATPPPTGSTSAPGGSTPAPGGSTPAPGGYGPPPQSGSHAAPPPAAQQGWPTPADPGTAPTAWSTPGGSNRAAATFDPKTVNPMDWGIIGAGVLAFIFSLFSYYTFSVKVAGLGGGSQGFSAWHGFFGWFAALLALAGAAVLAVEFFAPQIKLPFPGRLLTAALFAAATLCVLLALLIVPGNTGGLGSLGVSVNKGHGIGYWLSLIAIVAGLVLSVLRLKATGGSLPWEKSKTAR